MWLLNSYFEVQKSSGGIRFTTITKIEGSGTVYGQKTYDAVDISPYEHTYFRLKQVDYDGTFSLFLIIYVQQADHAGFALYANPASDVLYLSGDKRHGDLHISIFDHSGRIALQQTPPQQDHINLKIGSLLPGTYVIRIARPFSMSLWSSRFVKR
ncbi:T9SS type A sorting domain-containing protein [Dyadobacter sp. CY261]|uniref:T9SS type A sorting domain-containing protein n=1 Tax=Dyadobacter sp. CY261 TaxID=2907203 RepID=UPI001F3EB952|nr:T9SS type A sorting domain-containing protein [Dyadobacter sp. CY261]MCF0071186.1 T9SS type A sorting domain-containing protein [Dyadobacter sp. CY261]